MSCRRRSVVSRITVLHRAAPAAALRLRASSDTTFRGEVLRREGRGLVIVQFRFLSASIGPALARPRGHVEGSDANLARIGRSTLVPVGTTRDLPVACRGVEDDPCESCLQPS